MKMLKLALVALGLLTCSLAQPQLPKLTSILGLTEKTTGTARLYNYSDKDLKAHTLDFSKIGGGKFLSNDLKTIKSNDWIQFTFHVDHQLEIGDRSASGTGTFLHYDFTPSDTEKTLNLLVLSNPAGLIYLIKPEDVSTKVR